MANKTLETAVFGGGCFWCTEAIFAQLRGVSTVMPGYTGGTVKNPSYEQVSSGTTRHAEAIRIEFDPKEISYHDLLEVFFATHDPTTPGRQGSDVGEQYRSVIFSASPQQKEAAENYIEELALADEHSAPIVTEVQPLGEFYEAEDYHRRYYDKNPDKPYCQLVINPKLAKLREKYKKFLKP